MSLAVADDPPPQSIMDTIGDAQKLPAGTSIAAVPAAVSPADLQNLQDIALLDTYVSVNSAAYLYKLNPKGFDITSPDGAATFTKSLANARFRVFTEGLAGVLSLGDSSQQSFSKSTTSVDLHMEFLGTIFGSFGFAPSAMKELDGIMTGIVNNLSALQGSWSDQSQTLDHLISVYYFEPVPGLEDVKVPKMRLFYLHIDQSSWTASVGKSSVTHFEFHMNYSDQIATMSLTQMPIMRDKIQSYITTATNQGLAAIEKLVAMDAVKTDA
jgi:hypothetical protein